MKHQKQLVLLLSTQRSGSTWLADILDKAADGYYAVHGELLLPKQKVWDIGEDNYYRFLESPQYNERRPWALFRYLDELYERSDTSVAFKLMYSHVQLYPEIIPYIVRRSGRIKVIHLIRENYLNTLISLQRLQQSRIPHIHGHDSVQSTQVELDPGTINRSIDRLKFKIVAFHHLFHMLPSQYISIRYEALVAGNQREVASLLGFLDLSADSKVLESDLTRISRGQNKSLSNYEAIRAALIGTQYEGLLEAT